MADLDGVERKVARSRRHLDDLEREVARYQRSAPYRVGLERDSGAKQAVFKISAITEPIPDELAVIAGDAVHNLRTALDHLACAAVPEPNDNTAFPVWRKPTRPSAGQMKGLVGNKVAGASAGFMTTLHGLQPFFGGTEEYVRIVDYLDIVDKHRLLLTVGAAYSGLTIDMAQQLKAQWETISETPFDLPDGALAITLKPEDWGPLREGFELFRVPDDDVDQHKDVKFTFNVALGEPPALAGEPIVPTLRELVESVTGLITRLSPQM